MSCTSDKYHFPTNNTKNTNPLWQRKKRFINSDSSKKHTFLSKWQYQRNKIKRLNVFLNLYWKALVPYVSKKIWEFIFSLLFLLLFLFCSCYIYFFVYFEVKHKWHLDANILYINFRWSYVQWGRNRRKPDLFRRWRGYLKGHRHRNGLSAQGKEKEVR